MSNLYDKTLQQLRDEGYAVIIWTPEELGDCPTDVIEDISIERGWAVLHKYYNNKENDNE